MFFLAYLYTLTLFSVQLILAIGSPHKRDGVTTYIDRGHNPNNKIFNHYTALGGGLAAGFGLGDIYIENQTDIYGCQRSVNSYPYLFINEFGDSIGLKTFNFPACNLDIGYKSIGSQIESGLSLSPLPRVWYDFGQPDLVTISIGVEEHHSYTQIGEKCIHSVVGPFVDNQWYIIGCQGK